MKVALLPSTQWKNPVLGGGSEALYAHRIARIVQETVRKEGIDVEIFSAADSPESWNALADANTKGARAAVAWGAQLCVSIHSDGGYQPAEPSHRRLAALACYQEFNTARLARTLLDTYVTLMREVAGEFTSRGLQQRIPGRNGVAVLRIPEQAGIHAILIEVCWHDREPDATLLRERTAEIARCLAEAILVTCSVHFGFLRPTRKGGKKKMYIAPLTKFMKDDRGNKTYVYTCPAFHRNWYLNIVHEENRTVSVTIYANQQRGPGKQAFQIKVAGQPLPNPGYHSRLALPWEWASVSVHAPCEVVVLVDEG